MRVSRVTYFVGAIFSFLLSAQSVHAFGISPPEFFVTEELTSASSVTETVRLQRAVGESGALTFETDFHGDCDGCITGAATVTMPEDADAVEFTFVIAPGSASAGKHEQRVAFYLTSSVADGSGSTVSIKRGVTAVAWFTVASTATGTSGGSSTSSSGSSGGSGASSGGGTTDTSTTDDSGITSPASSETVGTNTASETDGTASTETEGVTADASEVQTQAPATSEPAATETSVATTTNASETEGTTESAQMTSDYDGNESINVQDGDAFMDAYDSGACIGTCDIDGDGEVGLSDLVLFISSIFIDTQERPTPPITPGPPLTNDEVVIYFEQGVSVGKHQFKLAAVLDDEIEDDIVFYALADTGATGLLATDMAFTFDTSLLQFIWADTSGSIFPYVDVQESTTREGLVEFLGATQTAFVGTRGYLATLHFRPLGDGDISLIFENVDVYSGSDEEAAPISTKDLIGEIVPEEDEIIVVASTVQNEHLYAVGETKKLWLTIILVMLLLSALAAWGIAVALRPNTSL